MEIPKTLLDRFCRERCHLFRTVKDKRELAIRCDTCLLYSRYAALSFNVYPQQPPPAGALCLTRDFHKGKAVYDILRFAYDDAGRPAFVDPVLPSLKKFVPPNSWAELKE